MHKNNDLLIMKDIENLKNLSNQLFEKTDFMEQNQIKSNLNVENNRDSINALKDSLNSIVFGLENVIKNLKYDKGDLDSIIKYYSDNIVNDSSLTNNIYKEQVQSFQLDSTKSNKTYYVIIGSFKEFKNAMDFKQIFIREYSLESKILTDKNKSWYYLYTNSSSNIDSLRGRLKELQAIDVKKIISENPWIYFE